MCDVTQLNSTCLAHFTQWAET